MLAVIAVLVAVGLALAMWLWSGRRAERAAIATEAATLQLYFPADEGWVREETRRLDDLPQPDDARAERVVSELLAGPSTGDLYPILPAGTTVDAAFVDEDGTCVIELLSETHREPPPMGSRQEAELLASLLESLSANVPAIERLQILWNGRQPESLGGHLDSTRPLDLRAARAVAQPQTPRSQTQQQ